MEQMGNIGSEVGRALKRKNEGNEEIINNAMNRALDLFDLIVSDPRWKNRLKEILRAREVVCDYLVGDNEYNSTPESLEKYFLYFAIAARLKSQ